MNMMLEVKRSAPVRTIITSPIGNIRAPAVLISPGACSWYHGAVSVESMTAQPNPSRGPVMTELKNNLSRRVCAFLVPIRLTSSTVCWGVKASILNSTLQPDFFG